MLFRLALAAFMGLSACADDGSKDTIANPDIANPDIGVGTSLRQTAALSGAYANRIRIVGQDWQASGPGQEVTLVFELAGIDSIRQFDMTVRPDPAGAFDLTSASFSPPSDDLLTPLPKGVQVADGELRFVWAMVDRVEPLPSTYGGGTLTVKTAATFNAFTRARLVVTALSIGPNPARRDTYGEDDLHLGVELK